MRGPAEREEAAMAEGLNRVYLLGNLGADPELRTTPGGQAVLKLRLATTESYVDKGGQRQERTEWHQVTVWGKRGEALGRILQKGSSIFVEGSIRTTSYEKDGEKRYRTEVVANNILLPGGRRGEAGAPRDGNRDASMGGGGRDDYASGPARSAPRSAPPQAAPGNGGEPYDDLAGAMSDDDIPF
jgi:single-strand DNA-binding protein